MKFTIQQPALADVIQIVSKAVATRTTKQALTGILLEATEDSLIAIAYDLELGIQQTVSITEQSKLSVSEPGSIVLPARFFADAVKKLPNPEVTIQVTNNYMTQITSGKAEFHIHGIDAAEFPKLPVFHHNRVLSIPGNVLKDVIRTTAFATSTVEVRPILTGIHIECEGQNLKLTATDGLRLATRVTTVEAPDDLHWDAVIPGKSLAELAKILPDDNTPVMIQFTDSHSLFEVASTLFYTRLIDGNYPDTSRLIPNGATTEVYLPVDEITGAIDRASLIARGRENHMVRLELANSQLTISSNSPEIGNVSEELSVSEKTGDDLVISFNARYVLDALRAIADGDVSVRFNGSNQPFVIRKRDEENALQLISPVLMR